MPITNLSTGEPIYFQVFGGAGDNLTAISSSITLPAGSYSYDMYLSSDFPGGCWIFEENQLMLGETSLVDIPYQECNFFTESGTFTIDDNSCSVSWTGPNDFTSTEESISGLESGVYTVTATANNGCTTTVAVTIANEFEGCMDAAACNYDPTATNDDDSCEFTSCVDCAGVPYGNAVVDECGVCDNDASNDCEQDCAGVWGGNYVTDLCGTCAAPEVPDCTQDCAGVWGGDSVNDECGVCDNDASNDCEQDCAGVWGGDSVSDECGVCDNDASNDCEQDCAGVWGGNYVTDLCGTCAAPEVPDCTQDCAGVWGGDSVNDECGVCGGAGITEGTCDCDGNVLDATGVCGGDCEDDYNGNGVCDNAEIHGCTYSDASNYNPEATADNGSCTYDNCDPNAGYDSGYAAGEASIDITSDNQEVYDGAYAEGIASVECPDGGSSCPGDLDNDGAVATTDLLIFLSVYGGTCDSGDVIVGCTYPAAVEYNSSANVDDGSCTFLADCAGVINGTSVLDECGSCDADASNDCDLSCGGLVSHEGHNYSTVQIGDQCWFSDNCRYLPEVSPSTASSLTNPYYYVYGYEGTDVAAAQATDNYATYGVLYNWPAVMTEGICPSGWHIPSDGEYTDLKNFLADNDCEEAVGDAMKSTSGWNDSGNGSNSSGFYGLPGGYRYADDFYIVGQVGGWWSATEAGPNSWLFALNAHLDTEVRDNLARDYGFSARCVRD